MVNMQSGNPVTWIHLCSRRKLGAGGAELVLSGFAVGQKCLGLINECAKEIFLSSRSDTSQAGPHAGTRVQAHR